MHMEDKNQAKKIAEALNKSYFHHRYPLGRTESKEIGLPVKEPDEVLKKLMWNVWEDIESEMQCNKPFRKR